MTGLLVCMAVCLVFVLLIFRYSTHDGTPMGLPGQLPPNHPLLADREDGRYHCRACSRVGQDVSFTDAGGLLVHEIETHPLGKP